MRDDAILLLVARKSSPGFGYVPRLGTLNGDVGGRSSSTALWTMDISNRSVPVFVDLSYAHKLRQVANSSIRAYVLGEHGDSPFVRRTLVLLDSIALLLAQMQVAWSTVSIGGSPLSTLLPLCGFAAALQSHLSRLRHQLSSVTRTRIIERIAAIDHFIQVGDQLKEMSSPPKDSPPLPELEVHRDGLACQLRREGSLNCDYVCHMPYGMKKHCKKEHRWINKQGKGGTPASRQRSGLSERPWRKGVGCQRFFTHGPGQEYFEVQPTEPIENIDMNERLKQSREEFDLKMSEI